MLIYRILSSLTCIFKYVFSALTGLFFSSHQVGHSEDTGAAYASTAAAAHGKKKTKYSGE